MNPPDRKAVRERRILWIAAPAAIVVAIVFWARAQDVPSVEQGVVVVPSKDTPARLSPLRPADTAADVDRIAKSEYGAAQPPPGGPGPEDTRPPTLGGSARFEPVRDGGKLTAYRVHGNAVAVEQAGFRDNDVVTVIDGVSVTDLPPNLEESGLTALLRPGKTVEVLRDGQPVAWRIGGKAG